MTNHLSRRKFLKQTAFGSLALFSSRFIPALGGRQIPAEIQGQLQYFSPHEYLVFEAIGERMIGKPGPSPPSATDLDVALRADKFLATADPEAQEQFHQLLTVFNAPFFTFLFDLRFSSFLHMTPEDQDSYIEDWMTSVLAFRRTGFQALKRVSLSMFYTEPRSWNEIGYDGLFVPE